MALIQFCGRSGEGSCKFFWFCVNLGFHRKKTPIGSKDTFKRKKQKQAFEQLGPGGLIPDDLVGKTICLLQAGISLKL